jgi:hypothetical protein
MKCSDDLLQWQWIFLFVQKALHAVKTIPCAGPIFLRRYRRSSFLQPSDSRIYAAPPSSNLPTMASVQSLQSIPRFLLPQGPTFLRPQTLLLLQRTTGFRYASTPAKGLSAEFLRRRAAQQAQQPKAAPVIPQPDKYRPPSHSARKPNRNLENKIYGAPVSEEDKKRMATKKYPNMMSPEGTFSHWFLHNRAIHLWITMVHSPPPPVVNQVTPTNPRDTYRAFSSLSPLQHGTWISSRAQSTRT